jgi:hypothetical protein
VSLPFASFLGLGSNHVHCLTAAFRPFNELTRSVECVAAFPTKPLPMETDASQTVNSASQAPGMCFGRPLRLTWQVSASRCVADLSPPAYPRETKPAALVVAGPPGCLAGQADLALTRLQCNKAHLMFDVCVVCMYKACVSHVDMGV